MSVHSDSEGEGKCEELGERKLLKRCPEYLKGLYSIIIIVIEDIARPRVDTNFIFSAESISHK